MPCAHLWGRFPLAAVLLNRSSGIWFPPLVDCKQHLVPAEPMSLLVRGFYDEHGRSELRRVLTDPFSATRLVQEFELEGDYV